MNSTSFYRQSRFSPMQFWQNWFAAQAVPDTEWDSCLVACRIDNLYNRAMIKSFRHKGLETFYRKGSRAGINPQHDTRLQAQLSALDVARSADDMAFPGWRLHPLEHNLSGYWSVNVNGNWRMIFKFDGEDAELVDYLDYHQEEAMSRMHNPSHPGEVLKDGWPEGVTVTGAALQLGITRATLSRILNGHAGITADMALRLQA